MWQLGSGAGRLAAEFEGQGELAQSVGGLWVGVDSITVGFEKPKALHGDMLGNQVPLKNFGSHIDASLSRQPLVKGERLVRL